jgi:hypothetical protein
LRVEDEKAERVYRATGVVERGRSLRLTWFD